MPPSKKKMTSYLLPMILMYIFFGFVLVFLIQTVIGNIIMKLPHTLTLGFYVIAICLLTFHSIIGCDMTSYYIQGKTTLWEKTLKSPSSLFLLKDFGKSESLFDESLANCIEFVHCTKYGEKPRKIFEYFF